MQHGSREWLEQRRGYVGASEVAAVLGLPGTYSTAYEVWLAKTQPPPEPTDSTVLRIGRLLEPAIIEWAEGAGVSAKRSGPLGFRTHLDYPMIGGHADAYGIEAKVLVYGSEHKRRHQWEAQCRTYMALYGAPSWTVVWARMPMRVHVLDMAALMGPERARSLGDVAEMGHKTYTRDESWEAENFPRVAEWWERHVVGGEAPPVDHSAACGRHLCESSPQLGPELGVNDAIAWDARAYVELGADIKRRKEMRSAAKHRIYKAIGDDRGVSGAWGRAVWSRSANRLTVTLDDG